MVRTIVVTLVWLVSFIFITPALSGERKMDTEKAFLILKNTQIVESRLIGEGGDISRVFQAYSILRSNSKSKDIFKKLVQEASNNAGIVYAVMWFYTNDRYLYLEVKNKMFNDDVVNIKVADCIDRYDMKNIFNEIENKNFIDSIEMKGLGR
jgi:hypothetical protein